MATLMSCSARITNNNMDINTSIDLQKAQQTLKVIEANLSRVQSKR